MEAALFYSSFEGEPETETNPKKYFSYNQQVDLS
jgi:hypothetical protein